MDRNTIIKTLKAVVHYEKSLINTLYESDNGVLSKFISNSEESLTPKEEKELLGEIDKMNIEAELPTATSNIKRVLAETDEKELNVL